MEKENVPEIRFKGFNDKWEEISLGDTTSSFEYGLNAAAKKYDGKNKYIRITDINDKSRKYMYDDIVSPNYDLSKVDNYKLYYGDILFARTGASVGKTYIYKLEDGLVYYAGFLIRIRVNNSYYPEFIFYNTLTDKYNNFIKIISQRSGQPGVNAAEYASYKLFAPDIKEQEKIGYLFENLDKKLELEKEKYKKLIDFKKSMLENMFPKEGENLPNLRFDGFDGEWNSYRIKDLFFITRGYVLSTNKISKNKNSRFIYPVFSSQTQNDGLLGYYDDYLYENAITWTTDGANAGTVRYRKGKFYSTNVNGVLLENKIKPNIAIAEMINKITPYHVVRVGNPKLMNNIMAEIEIKIPKNIQELDMISNFFKNLDKKIEDSEEKIKKIGDFKKSLMEKMFV